MSSNLLKTRKSGAYKAALFTSKALALSVVLALVTVFLGPLAAAAVVCGVLWVALYTVIRTLRKERLNVDGHLAAARDKYGSIIGVMCGAMNLKDDLNSAHTARVSHLAEVVATELGMRREELRVLQKAAIFADIGKIEIAENILSKPGDLNEHEWQQMKRHPEFGYQILSGISHLRDAGEVVLSSHERFDGQGYPRGLKGEEIPLTARILSVVDAYTAMTSNRPHRKQIGHDVAVKEILRNSLTQFDPEVVRAFVRCEERDLIDESIPGQQPPAVEEPETAPAASVA